MTKKILLVLLLTVIPLTILASDIEGIYQSISESEWELTVSLKADGNLIIKTESWEPGEYHKREIKEMNGSWDADENDTIHLNYDGITDTLIYYDNLQTDWAEQEDDNIPHPGIVYHPYYSPCERSIIRNTKLWKLPHRFYSEKRTKIQPLIEKYFPEWYILEYKFLDDNLKKFLDKNMIKNSPGWIIEDFNGDGSYDYAILIYRIDEIAQEIETKLVLFFSKENFQLLGEPIVLSEKRLNPKTFLNTYLNLIYPDSILIVKKKSIHRTRKAIPELPAIQIIHYPQNHSPIYYWNKTTKNFEETSPDAEKD